MATNQKTFGKCFALFKKLPLFYIIILFAIEMADPLVVGIGEEKMSQSLLMLATLTPFLMMLPWTAFVNSIFNHLVVIKIADSTVWLSCAAVSPE